MPDGGYSSIAPEEFERYLARLAATAGEPHDCAGVWVELMRGRLTVIRHFSRGNRAHLLLARGAREAVPIVGRARDVLEKVLLGEPPKVVAGDLGITTSTITFLMKRSLSGIGVETLPSKAPALLALLLQASRRRLASPLRAVELQCGPARSLLLSGELTTPALESSLSPAEKSVVFLRLEGRSLVEIARARRTSTRTVANQLAAASRRLGVSGRSSWVRHVALST